MIFARHSPATHPPLTRHSPATGDSCASATDSAGLTLRQRELPDPTWVTAGILRQLYAGSAEKLALTGLPPADQTSSGRDTPFMRLQFLSLDGRIEHGFLASSRRSGLPSQEMRRRRFQARSPRPASPLKNVHVLGDPDHRWQRPKFIAVQAYGLSPRHFSFETA